MKTEDTIGSVCVKNEVQPGWTCACRVCEELEKLKQPLPTKARFDLFLADHKAKEKS